MESQNSKKLLFLSWTIPPYISGSAYISHQLAKAIPSHEILAVGGGTPFQKSSMEYEHVHYHYLPTEWSLNGLGARFFGPLRWFLFPFVLIRLMRIVKTQPINKILVVFPDGYFLLLAWVIHRWLKVPLFSYFHNTYVDNRKGLNKFFATWIQHKIFQSSTCIFTMSEGMNAYYLQRYPLLKDKLVVLPHCFSVSEDKEPNALALQPGKPMQCVLIGTINQSNLEATKRVMDVFAKHSDQFHLDVYSPSNKQLLKIKYQLDLDRPGLAHRGSVPQEQVHQVLQQYDACVLTHGFHGEYTLVEYQTIFPTRTIPLLVSGIPILAHTPEFAFLTGFLKTYDCAELVTTADEEKLVVALTNLSNDTGRRQALHSKQLLAAEYFSKKRIIGLLNKHLYQDGE